MDIFKVTEHCHFSGTDNPVFFTDYSDAVQYLIETQLKNDKRYDGLTNDELSGYANLKIRGHHVNSSFTEAMIG